jgi:hypothetical protein
MKTSTIFFATAFLAFSMPSPATEGLEAKVHAADIEQFHALINDAYNHPHAPVYERELIDHALSSKRLDLVADVFSNPNLSIYFRKKAGELETSDYTDKIATVMLRSPMATFWPYEGPPRNSNGIIENAGPEALLIKPLTTAFERHLPDVSRETLKAMIWTKVGRNQLADQLYAAMQAKGVTFTDTEKAIILQGGSAPVAPLPLPTPTPQPNTPAVKPSPNTVPQESQAPATSAAPIDTVPEPGGSGSPAFWIPVVGLVAAVGWWLAARKKA